MRTNEATVEFRLRSAQGHLDGVLRMVQEDRYCIEILNQLAAVQGALDHARREILEAHLRGCVPDALASGRVEQAVAEVVEVALGRGLSHPVPVAGGHRRHDRCAAPSGETGPDERSLP